MGVADGNQLNPLWLAIFPALSLAILILILWINRRQRIRNMAIPLHGTLFVIRMAQRDRYHEVRVNLKPSELQDPVRFNYDYIIPMLDNLRTRTKDWKP